MVRSSRVRLGLWKRRRGVLEIPIQSYLKRTPVQTSKYWAKLQVEEEEEEPTGAPRMTSVALSDAGCVCGSFEKAAEGPSHTGGVSNTAGAGSDLSGMPKGSGHVKAKGASGAPCHSMSVSRGKG